MLYRRLIELRRAEPALAVGEFAPLPATDDMIAYVRKAEDRRLLILLNLGPNPQDFGLLDLASRARLMLSTNLDRHREALNGSIRLRGDEGAIVELI
jgi:alpha-glucosidase